MRIFLSVLILIFSFQSFTKADDISEFEIEGISIEDSLLDYFSEKEINENLSSWYNDDKYSTAMLRLQNYEIFKDLDITFLTNDRKYKIVDISAIHEDAEKENCKSIKKEIVNDIKKIINIDSKSFVETHPIDKSGKSKVDSTYFYYDNGDAIAIQCYFFSKNVDYDDGLKLSISKNDYTLWLEHKAYK
tara:strand:+ start:217 stop:783 length:567 start_codon:yes stop_codon:yes gene_type:complete